MTRLSSKPTYPLSNVAGSGKKENNRKVSRRNEGKSLPASASNPSQIKPYFFLFNAHVILQKHRSEKKKAETRTKEKKVVLSSQSSVDRPPIHPYPDSFPCSRAPSVTVKRCCPPIKSSKDPMFAAAASDAILRCRRCVTQSECGHTIGMLIYPRAQTKRRWNIVC